MEGELKDHGPQRGDGMKKADDTGVSGMTKPQFLEERKAMRKGYDEVVH